MIDTQTTPTTVDYAYMPDHRIEIEPTVRWVRVKLNGAYVADSRRVLLVREADRTPLYYFPQEDVRLDWLKPASEEADEEGKIYWDVTVGERTVKKAGLELP